MTVTLLPLKRKEKRRSDMDSLARIHIVNVSLSSHLADETAVKSSPARCIFDLRYLPSSPLTIVFLTFPSLHVKRHSFSEKSRFILSILPARSADIYTTAVGRTLTGKPATSSTGL